MNDDQQIRFALQLLEGNAANWARRQFRDMHLNPRPQHLVIWGNFVDNFNARFLDVQEQEKAQAQIYSGKLIQTAAARTYIDLLLETADKADIRDEQQRISLIRMGLKTEVRNALATYLPPNLAEYIAMVVRTDEELQAIRTKDNPRKPKDKKATGSKGTESRPDNSKYKLTEEEKKEHIEGNLCFKCHKAGHGSKNCKSERTVYSKVKKKTQVANVETKETTDKEKGKGKAKTKVSEVKTSEKEVTEDAGDETDFSDGD